MKQIDESIQRQLDKPQTWFVKYFPARIRNVGEQEKSDRQIVYDFKDGKNGDYVARETARHMMEQYGEGCKNIVFSCVPASSAEKNDLRYKSFCQEVCELTGAINGFDHAHVLGERLTIHDNRKDEKQVRKVNIVDFDEPFYNGKQVLIFDDVITRGLSYAVYANQLESFGAHVIGGMFLARTHYKVR